MYMKLSYCLIRQTVFLRCRQYSFFINFRILTRDPKVPNAKILKSVDSRVSVPGFSSHSSVLQQKSPRNNKPPQYPLNPHYVLKKLKNQHVINIYVIVDFFQNLCLKNPHVIGIFVDF